MILKKAKIRQKQNSYIPHNSKRGGIDEKGKAGEKVAQEVQKTTETT